MASPDLSDNKEKQLISQEGQQISGDWIVDVGKNLKEKLQLISQEGKQISDEWMVEVANNLKEREETVARTSMRVPKALIKAKPEAYIPQMVSLGPYHHRSLQEEAIGPDHQRLNHLSQMDFYKLNSTRDAAQNKPGIIEYFFTHVKEMASEFEEFYNWKIDDPKKFGLMMMVDGFFLYQILKNGLHDLQREVSKSNNDIINPTLTSIRCDIVKLENQIPLFLLTEMDSTLHNKTLKVCLKSIIPHLSCFQVSHDLKIEYEDEQHLLGCMHKYVSSLLQIHNPGEDKPRKSTCCESIVTAIGDMVAAVFAVFFPHPAKKGRVDFLDRYNAKELVKVGIKFKSFSNVPEKIRFEKRSDTLFLPRIVISDDYTEVMMRNLLALEFSDATRPKHVTQYVELMDCLIDTPEDVSLLRECHVIDRHSMMITDEYVVKMWDGLAKSLFFSAFVEHPQGIKAAIREKMIRNYYKSKIRSWWDRRLSRAWKM